MIEPLVSSFNYKCSYMSPQRTPPKLSLSLVSDCCQKTALQKKNGSSVKRYMYL